MSTTRMIDHESRLRDIEKEMEEGATCGYLSFIRIRHAVREDFRTLMKRVEQKSPLVRMRLREMSRYVQDSYEIVSLGQQMHSLGEAISMGKLVEYEQEKNEAENVERVPVGAAVSNK